MPGAHRLEESEGFFATDLTDDQVLGTLTESCLEEFVHVDLPFPGDVKRLPGHTGNPVRMGEFKFTGIFKGDDLGKWRDKKRDRVERGSLSRSSPACKDT